ncbi:hypothetical protein AAHA92_00953 [Salvia divinorum]|uniref:Uncharacterized protein n=1 Tax=Salvia divinorum TaxID=28513 RepID=A0ABD1INL3_SALDI
MCHDRFTHRRNQQKKTHISSEKVEIHILVGEKPEIYTRSCWVTVCDCLDSPFDGFNDDILRIYEPYEGKSCHQCRLSDFVPLVASVAWSHASFVEIVYT